MKTACLRASSDIPLLFFYGELDAETRATFARHLESCAECAATVAELEQVRAVLADRGTVTRSPREWDGFMARLNHALDRPKSGSGTTSRTDAGMRAGRAPRVARGTWLALAATLLLGIALGLFWQQRTLGPERPPQEEGAATLDAAAARHFDRAKIVLLGLSMKDPASATAADWKYERALAASLLPETRLYRLSAADRGDSPLAGLLRDLEAVLLHTAMSSEADAPELQRIQRMIRARDLIVRMGLRESDTSTTRGI